MKKIYSTPIAIPNVFAAEEIMVLTTSGEYDESSNSISWDDLAGAIGL